jgi:TonB family protein
LAAIRLELQLRSSNLAFQASALFETHGNQVKQSFPRSDPTVDANAMPSPTHFGLRAAAMFALTCAITSHASSPPGDSQAQQEYWAQVDRQDWSAAAAAAESLVATARDRADQPLALADALSLLGDAQLAQADYVAAENAFREALQIVEQDGHAANPKLIGPLRGLGYTLAAAGKHEQAAAYLERALLISRRSYGLFDRGQQGMLRQLADSLSHQGRIDEGERHMNYLQRIGERIYGRRDPRLVDTLCTIGDWYAQAGTFSMARAKYREALQIVEKKLGENDLAAVQPLRALARSYTKELYYASLGLRTESVERAPRDADGSTEPRPLNPRFLSSDGEKALERALKIMDAQNEPPSDVLIATLIQAGDWFQTKHQPERALSLYRRAASLGAGAPDHTRDSQPAPLSFPVRVYYPTPLLATRNTMLPPQQVEEKFVEVEFTVTGAGDVANARVTDRNGTSRQASEALQAIRAARFRPKFVNGEPVETPGLTNREVFRVRKQTDEQNES